MKQKLTALVLSLLVLFLPNKTHAQSYNICESLIIQPSSVILPSSNSELPSGIHVSVNLTLSGYSSASQYQVFVNPWRTAHYFGQTVTTQTNRDPDNNRVTVSATIPSTAFGNSFTNGQGYTIYIETIDTHQWLKDSGGQNCSAELVLTLDDSYDASGNCTHQGLTNNKAGCYWTGTSWDPIDLDNYCNDGFVPVCYLHPEDPARFPEEFIPGFCSTCIQPPTELKDYGQICTSQQQCGHLSCRFSNTFGNSVKTCLYPENSQGLNETCIAGENECKTQDAGFNATCGTEGMRTGTLTTCQILDEWCDPAVNDFCPGDLICIDNHCREPETSPDITPEVTLPPTSPTLPPEEIFTGSVFAFTPCYTEGYDNENGVLIGKGELGITTAIGCLPASPGGMVSVLFTIATGIAGGLAFLLILFGGSQMMLSKADPKKLTESQEIISSAVAGLLIIILAIFILRVIGVNILAIPGFG